LAGSQVRKYIKTITELKKKILMVSYRYGLVAGEKQATPAQKKSKERTLRNSGQELAFRKQQANFLAFFHGIQRAEKIHGKRRGEEPIESRSAPNRQHRLRRMLATSPDAIAFS
jgi:hypothetical protein